MTKNNNSKDIQRYLQDRRDRMIRLTQELCSIPTENPPGLHYKSFVDFLRDYVESIGLDTEVVVVPLEYQKRFAPRETWNYPRYNLIARWDVGAQKTLHFNSHYDVVPATADWKTDPYQPVLKAGKLHGRGTGDMKGSLAASIFAVQALKTCGVRPPWNIELSFTADEEINGQCGVGYIVKKKIVRPNAAVICEGGSGDIISYGHRGSLWLDIHIEGVSAHGSAPMLGVNAFEKGVNLAERILAMKDDFPNRKTAHTAVRPEFRYPSLSLGGISGGGQKVNIIPDRFHFTVDRRLIPEEDVKETLNEFEAIIQSAQKKDRTLKAKIDVRMASNAGLSDPKSPLCLAAKQAVKNVYNKSAKMRIFGGFTDLHFFTNHAKCPTIGYGVECEGIHSSREFIPARSLVETARVYAGIIMNMTE